MRNKLALSVSAGVVIIGVVSATALGISANAQPPVNVVPPAPTAEELEAKVNTLLDPGVAARSRSAEIDIVSGGGPDPLMYDPDSVEAGISVVQQFEVTDFVVDGNTAMATGVVTLDGVPVDQPGRVPYVVEDGQWKIDRLFVCTLTTFEGEPPPPGCE